MDMALLPRDPALPHLARALDEQAMGEVFDQALREHGTRVEACALERIKYRPQRNCTLAYRLRLRAAGGDSFDQHVAARLCGEGDVQRRAQRAAPAARWPTPAGPRLHLLPGLDMLTWWWPNDAKLQAPRWLADEAVLRGQLLPPVLQALAGPGATLRSHQLHLVQYVPEQRLTARVQLAWRDAGGQDAQATLYAKASVEPDSAIAHGLLAGLQASPAWRQGRLRTPRALLLQPEAGLHWQQGLPGTPLLDLPAGAERLPLMAQLGDQLAALHATPLPLTARLDENSLRQRLADVGQVLARTLAPAHHPTLQRCLATLDNGLGLLARLPAATLHGDLHPNNLLVHEGRLAMIDVDGLHSGPAALELGSWVADGVYRALLAGQAPRLDRDGGFSAMLRAYAQAGGLLPTPRQLAWASAWALLTERAFRCVVNLKAGRWALAPQLLDWADTLGQSPDWSAVA